MTKVCPDKKKVITDPFDPSVKVQIRYRMGHLQTLFEQYKAEVENECSWTSFKRYIPFNVKKPNPSDWGTCLCIACLNPELKFQRLIDLKSLNYTHLKEEMCDEKYPELILVILMKLDLM